MNIIGAEAPTAALSTLTNQQQPAGAVRSNGHRSVKSPCTRSQARRFADDLPEVSDVDVEMEEANSSLLLCDLPDELLMHALSHLAYARNPLPGPLEYYIPLTPLSPQGC